MVKRVFITSDLGEDAMPKWASWIKVVIDGLFFFFPIRASNPSQTYKLQRKTYL
jgi:hypothetical protein